jgi:hypothetical protein
MKRLLGFLWDSYTAAMTGAFVLGSFAMFTSGQFNVGRVSVVLLGVAYGVCLRALISLFPVKRWGLAIAGFIVGPLPITLVLSLQRKSWGSEDDRGAVWLLLCVLGMLIGLMEWARDARRAEELAEFGQGPPT